MSRAQLIRIPAEVSGKQDYRMQCAGEDLMDTSDEKRLLQRLLAFADDALVPQPTGSPLMSSLVRKLHEGLASTERFPVQYSQLTPTAPSLRAFGGAGGSAGAIFWPVDFEYICLCEHLA